MALIRLRSHGTELRRHSASVVAPSYGDDIRSEIRLAYNLYFFPDISQFPCQPSLPTLFLYFSIILRLRK